MLSNHKKPFSLAGCTSNFFFLNKEERALFVSTSILCLFFSLAFLNLRMSHWLLNISFLYVCLLLIENLGLGEYSYG